MFHRVNDIINANDKNAHSKNDIRLHAVNRIIFLGKTESRQTTTSLKSNHSEQDMIVFQSK